MFELKVGSELGVGVADGVDVTSDDVLVDVPPWQEPAFKKKKSGKTVSIERVRVVLFIIYP